MEWADQVDLSRFLVAAAPYGGPIGKIFTVFSTCIEFAPRFNLINDLQIINLTFRTHVLMHQWLIYIAFHLSVTGQLRVCIDKKPVLIEKKDMSFPTIRP